jgi:hypothetical protein
MQVSVLLGDNFLCAKKICFPTGEQILLAMFLVTALGLQIEFFLELFHTSAFFHGFLLAGVKRMAFRTDFNTNLVLGGFGFEIIAARAMHVDFFVLRMDALFHFLHLFPVTASNGSSGVSRSFAF